MLAVTFLVVFASITHDSQQTTDEKQPFRSNKMNIIWAKAQNKMSTRKLNEFYRKLEAQDRDEMNWKKKKAGGEDEDGTMEAKLRKNLIGILEKHGLAKHVDTFVERQKKGNKTSGMFGDQRLDSLWNAVQKQGKFSVEELKELEAEFNHHTDKVAEYNNMQRLLNKHDGVSISENSVLSQSDLNKGKLEELSKQIEGKQKEVYRDFVRLKKKAMGGTEKMQFEDDRVNELWQKAVDGGFSVDELQSIKEELSHFDHKILKHKHYKEQAKESETLFENGHDHLKQKHKDLKKKAKEQGRWVKKMHKTMLNRVTKTEL